MVRLFLTITLSLGAVPGQIAHAQEVDAGALYQDFCSVCHGDVGDGKSRAMAGLNPPPRDFTAPQATAVLTRERMIASTTFGVPGTAMTAWNNQLSATEIAAIVDYVREQFMMPSTTATDNEGQRIYAEYCSVCHGDHGDGQSRATGSLNPPPRSFTDTSARNDLSHERMLFSVRYGRANTAMTGWNEQLGDDGVKAVVDYIRVAFMGIRQEAPMAMEESHGEASHDEGAPDAGAMAGGHLHSEGEADMSAPLPDGLIGDVAWGRAFYEVNCATCHGRDGDGLGPRAYFIFPKPRDFHHEAARASLNRPHMYEAIAHGKLGTEMPGWRTVMTPQEMANVAEYVFSAFIAPDGVQVKAMQMDGDAHGDDHGDAHGDDHAN